MFELLGGIGAIFAHTWYIIIPLLFWQLFYSLWKRYSCILEFYSKQNEVLLEIIPPRDIEKSPKIMEGFFEALSATDSGKNVIDMECRCQQNPYFSLEIVGTEGVAHFYIRTPSAFRNFVESSLYAQYPDLEIMAVDDYVYNIPMIIPNPEWVLRGFDLTLLMPDPYPIKTYKYFEEDVTGKMIDPLSTLVEGMSNLGPGQHIWLQFVIQAARPRWFGEWGTPEVQKLIGKAAKKGSLFEHIIHDSKDVLSNVFTGWWAPATFTPFAEPKKDEQPLEFRLTPGEKQVLKSLEENIAKPMFATIMRLVVVGRKENFSGTNITAAMGSVKQFSDNHTNQFVPVDRSKVYADYVFVKKREAYRMRRLLSRYRDRDDLGYAFHLSSEELASVFHFPDMSVMAPGLQRTDSRRGSAPGNLPIQ